MDQRGTEQPRHERGILHRVPGPVTAPAEFVVGPAAAQQDAGGEKAPGDQRPAADQAGPKLAAPPGNKCREGEGERHRKADVAEIEHRRVNHHARVLQQGIQVVAVGRNRHQPFEGIGQKQNQAEETDNQPALHRDDERQVLWIAPPAVPGDDQGIERQNPRPQVERAFMTAPERRDLIKERQQRVGMLRHVQHREITADKGMYQHQSAETRKREHQHCRAHREPGQRRLAGGTRHGRRERLHQRHGEREHGGKMPKLDQVQGKISHAVKELRESSQEKYQRNGLTRSNQIGFARVSHRHRAV